MSRVVGGWERSGKGNGHGGFTPVGGWVRTVLVVAHSDPIKLTNRDGGFLCPSVIQAARICLFLNVFDHPESWNRNPDSA
ncbi:hypothetical protein ACFPFX_11700 [Streptomyces mauvecolor]|uniref:Uncharacterized protein n=1 Tax=Streptomyces mauvecolor TaxID=58345 RepID=A0ABV9UNI0_9ACTN